MSTRISKACRLGFSVSLIALAVSVVLPRTAGAQVRGEILGPGASKVPVALPRLKWLGGTRVDRAADEFIRVLSGDLELSGLFHVINPSAYIEDPQTSGITRDTINFDNWHAIGALGLARGGYSGSESGVTIEARFFDVADRSSTGGSRFRGSFDEVPAMAHRMADSIIEFVTGSKGPFNSKLAFVSDRNDRFRELYLYSFDGRVGRVTNDRSITMAPSWSPAGRSLLFTSFKAGRPGLYTFDLASRSEIRIATRFGVNVGGIYSPNAKKILLSREVAGNTDIYSIDVDRQEISPVTSHWGIDVDPTWAPDGLRIAFCSSRAGSPQVYTMTPDGTDITRLTFEGGYNCSPVWSPNGRTIAYAGRVEGRYQIFVIPAGGGEPRRLTSEGSNEDPTWSPDSRYIAFSRRSGGRTKLFMVDAQSGHWLQQLTHGSGADKAPSWSPWLD